MKALTFNEIYDAFFALYSEWEELNRAAEVVSIENQIVFWSVCDFYTTLLRFQRNDEYAAAVESTVNNYDREDAAIRAKLCTLFNVEESTVNAKVLFLAVEYIRHERGLYQ